MEDGRAIQQASVREPMTLGTAAVSTYARCHRLAMAWQTLDNRVLRWNR